MQACIETAPPPAAHPAPAWSMSFARPSTSGLRTAEILQGVPKPVLQTIFGKPLGRRIWDQARCQTAQADAVPAHAVTDAQISAGMVRHASEQAAEALREARRQAKSLSITIIDARGETQVARTHLAIPSSESSAIAEAATKLLSELPTHALQSFNLTLSTVAAPASQDAPAIPVGAQHGCARLSRNEADTKPPQRLHQVGPSFIL